ncbi:MULTISPECIES: hypothetical protein [unclassified Rhizobium]|jgi:hypothetical protein|uniref:hypothetical protein n=1 Tax=unclassified Rhizobium TaxID=2613769 RepID=UPI000AB69B10|nr:MULTISPECIES: hypothetical protein [unclassified Rhizobium]RKD51970.1 hypothetical protein BJ928_1171 [Rhizobium sp. WW_1]
MENLDLRADCARCAGLCCLALSFDRSSLFAIDKAAGHPCPHLDDCAACTIHLRRAELGFRGCIEFDCLGAGQRVTQEIFKGRNWIEDRSLLGPMCQAFTTVLRAHECLLLLREAKILPLSSFDRQRLAELQTAIENAGASIQLVEALRSETSRFLSSLQSYFRDDPEGERLNLLRTS